MVECKSLVDMAKQYLISSFVGSSFYGSTDRGAFGDALAEMDDSIGKILNHLDESGLRDQTMVFFTSDNG